MTKKTVFITNSAEQTRKLGGLLAEELRGAEIVCLTGELGSGKTTFAQGILKGLGVKGPYTSPTFVVMKYYKKKFSKLLKVRPFGQGSTFPSASSADSSRSNLSGISKNQTLNIYHIDAYRVGPKDILDLGWEEIVSGKNNVVIVEWGERIKRIIPKKSVWMKFDHKGRDEREIIFKSKS